MPFTEVMKLVCSQSVTSREREKERERQRGFRRTASLFRD